MVTPFRSERTLAYLYSIGGFASLLQVICTAIIWLHWRIGNIFVFIKFYLHSWCVFDLQFSTPALETSRATARTTMSAIAGAFCSLATLWLTSLEVRLATACGELSDSSFPCCSASSLAATMSIVCAAKPRSLEAAKWKCAKGQRRSCSWRLNKNCKRLTTFLRITGPQLQLSRWLWSSTLSCTQLCWPMGSSAPASSTETASSNTRWRRVKWWVINI